MMTTDPTSVSTAAAMYRSTIRARPFHAVRFMSFRCKASFSYAMLKQDVAQNDEIASPKSPVAPRRLLLCGHMTHVARPHSAVRERIRRDRDRRSADS